MRRYVPFYDRETLRAIRILKVWRVYNFLMYLAFLIIPAALDLPTWSRVLLSFIAMANIPWIKDGSPFLPFFNDLLAMFLNGICFILIAILKDFVYTGWTIFFYVSGGIRIFIFLVCIIILICKAKE